MTKPHNEGEDNPNFKHGMFMKTQNLSHMEKLHVFASAEDYMETLGGEDNLKNYEMYDCYLLALTEYRIAKAEGIMFDEVEEYLNTQGPEKNLQTLVDRRQKLRKDLGMLADSPESRQAESASGFFDAMAGNSDDE